MSDTTGYIREALLHRHAARKRGRSSDHPGQAAPSFQEGENYCHALLARAACVPSVTELSTVLADLRRALGPTCTAEVFGSRRSGLATAYSDIDVIVCPVDVSSPPTAPGSCSDGASRLTPHQRQALLANVCVSSKVRQRNLVHLLNATQRQLHVSRAFGTVTCIRHARIPIVKCVHKATHVSVDCAFLLDGSVSTDFLLRALSQAPRVARPLIRLLKVVMAHWDCGDASRGGLGSFPLSLLCLWFLHVHPEGLTKGPSLWLLFVGFCRYFAKFPFSKKVVQASHAWSSWTLSDKPFESNHLHITTPLDPSRNAASACTLFGSRVVTMLKMVTTAAESCSNGLSPAMLKLLPTVPVHGARQSPTSLTDRWNDDLLHDAE